MTEKSSTNNGESQACLENPVGFKERFDYNQDFKLDWHDPDEATDGYQLKWIGKDYARLQAGTAPKTIIIPDSSHNKENKNAENIFLTGDNLEVLKHLQNSYKGAIKMIYIDPPYNTGSDGFVYNDKFEFKDEQLKDMLGLTDNDVKRLHVINGRSSHSAWLTFMYPRLKIARNLLKEDGVIFISIDDNEQANLKLLCDEIFGESNFLVTFPRVTKKGGKSSDVTAKNHDYVLMYAKTGCSDLIGISHNDDGYSNQDEFFETRGFYKLNQTLDYDSLGYVKTLDYPIKIKGEIFYAGGSEEIYKERQAGQHGRADWGWRWSKDLFEFGYNNGFIEIRRGDDSRPRIYTKTYQNVKIKKVNGKYEIVTIERVKPLSTLEFTENKYSNDNATKSIDTLIGKDVFEYTKPPELITQLARLVNDTEFTVCDFFAGSGTTAQAVMQLNKEDGGNRKWILCNLDEPTKENSEAKKAGYNTIDEISRERIKKAAEKLEDTSGFKHYYVKEPNALTIDKITEFDITEHLLADNMVSEFDNEKTGTRGEEVILTTWLTADGYKLTSKVEELDFKGFKAHYVDNSLLYIISNGWGKEQTQELLNRVGTHKMNLNRIIVYGYSFSFESMKELEINVKQSLNDHKVEIKKRY